MSKENTITEYDFDFNYITSFFTKMNCLGPGCKEATEKAASFIPMMSDNAVIADLGCGTGRQTIDMARCVNGKVHAIDISPAMIEMTRDRIKREGLETRISAEEGSMDDLCFEENSLDLIWAEGSIYHIGYENGLRLWHKYVKKGGFIALTDCCWLSNERPEEKEWLEENMLEIDSISNKMRVIENIGYKPVASFIIPESCWTENYYSPMERRIEEFRQENNNDGKSKTFTDMLKYEIDYYKRNKEYYGYVFFIMEKV